MHRYHVGRESFPRLPIPSQRLSTQVVVLGPLSADHTIRVSKLDARNYFPAQDNDRRCTRYTGFAALEAPQIEYKAKLTNSKFPNTVRWKRI